jgi:YfiH family protein
MRSTVAKKKSEPRKRRAAKTAEWKLRRAAGLQILEAPLLTRLRWVTHGFSTRPGGTSEIAGNSNGSKGALNLGFTEWDSRERVLENRNKFVHAIGAAKMRIVTLRQFHSDVAHRVDSAEAEDSSSEAPRADALFTRQPHMLLCIQTADCVPILLADTKRRAVAAIHSGWRGTLRRIAAKTLGRMQMEFGTRPEDVIAALGPGIGRCCYEVGSEVAREFAAQFSGARDWFDGPFDALAAGANDPNWLPWLTMRPPGHPPPPPCVHLDLIAANRAILAEAGVPPSQISASNLCTACRGDLFFSYRRERNTGRMMAAIGIV